MNREIRGITWAFLAVIFHCSAANAGPWTKKLGEGYFKVGQSVYSADGYSSGGDYFGGRYLGFTTSLYSELGLPFGLQGVASLPFVIGTSTKVAGSATSTGQVIPAGQYRKISLGDILVGLQYGLPTDTPLALRLDLKIPGYSVPATTGLAEAFPGAGDGQVDATLWGSAGGSFGDVYAYVETGFRYRSPGGVASDTSEQGRVYAHGFVGFAQVGYLLVQGFYVNAYSQWVWDGSADAITKRYVNLAASVFWKVWKGWALEASFEGSLVAQNGAMGFNGGLGLSYSLGGKQ
jgi:hypothetical protein